MKKIISILLTAAIFLSMRVTAFAADSAKNYNEAARTLNENKQFISEKYLSMFGYETDNTEIIITYDRPVTPELVKQSETQVIKIQTADIMQVPSKKNESRSNTLGWDRTGTYLCDGQYFYVGVDLEVNVLTKNGTEYYQLSKYTLYWDTDNPFIGDGYNDANGYCSGTNEEAVIRQYGLMYSTEKLGAADEIELSFGPHGLYINGFSTTNTWYNREGYSCSGIGGIASLATYHIKTADSVVNGVHNDVHYYYIEDFYVGAGSHVYSMSLEPDTVIQ